MNTEHALDFSGCAGHVEGLGPGRRAVLWVRGCSVGCPGCMTPELWASAPAPTFTKIERVAELLRPLLQNSAGLTISGGEPMEQPAALKNLVRLLRGEFPELEVLVYSGYALEALQARDETRDFLNEIDILIDRPFEQAAANTLPWRGSDNQRVHYLSPRAQRHAGQEAEPVAARPLQIQMLGGDQFRIIGIPRRGDLEKYRKLMDARGLRVRKGKGNHRAE